MILMKSSADHQWPWADLGADAEAVFEKTYPSLHKHFKRYEAELKNREDQGRHWWELRPSQNYVHFEGSYIAYQDIAYHSAFAVAANTLPEMTAFCLPAADDTFLLAVLNSPVMWYLLSRITIHGKDEALRLKTDKILTIPIPQPSKATRSAIGGLTPRLRQLALKRLTANRMVSDWLSHTFDLPRDDFHLVDFSTLAVDAFVATVIEALPKKRKLTAAELGELKREHASTVAPALKERAEAIVLENKLSDLVNSAYGLTGEDVELMWKTAPPRMPLTASGLASVGSYASEENDE